MTSTAPWSLAGEQPSEWWYSRVLAFERVEAIVQEHLENQKARG